MEIRVPVRQPLPYFQTLQVLRMLPSVMSLLGTKQHIQRVEHTPSLPPTQKDVTALQCLT